MQEIDTEKIPQYVIVRLTSRAEKEVGQRQRFERGTLTSSHNFRKVLYYVLNLLAMFGEFDFKKKK